MMMMMMMRTCTVVISVVVVIISSLFYAVIRWVNSHLLLSSLLSWSLHSFANIDSSMSRRWTMLSGFRINRWHAFRFSCHMSHRWSLTDRWSIECADWFSSQDRSVLVWICLVCHGDHHQLSVLWWKTLADSRRWVTALRSKRLSLQWHRQFSSLGNEQLSFVDGESTREWWEETGRQTLFRAINIERTHGRSATRTIFIK